MVKRSPASESRAARRGQPLVEETRGGGEGRDSKVRVGGGVLVAGLEEERWEHLEPVRALRGERREERRLEEAQVERGHIVHEALEDGLGGRLERRGGRVELERTMPACRRVWGDRERRELGRQSERCRCQCLMETEAGSHARQRAFSKTRHARRATYLLVRRCVCGGPGEGRGRRRGGGGIDVDDDDGGCCCCRDVETLDTTDLVVVVLASAGVALALSDAPPFDVGEDPPARCV